MAIGKCRQRQLCHVKTIPVGNIKAVRQHDNKRGAEDQASPQMMMVNGHASMQLMANGHHGGPTALVMVAA